MNGVAAGDAPVAALEAALRDAMLAGDVDALDRLLADDLVFTDQDGAVWRKADDLAAHRSRALTLSEIVPDDPVVRRLGEGAVAVIVAVRIAGVAGGQGFDGTFRYTRVWAAVEGRWRVRVAHCSAVASSDNQMG